MKNKRHDFQFSDRVIRQMEYVLPKLKYSVYFQQIKYWLENFEENEVENALDFLFYLEYISSSELQVRLDHQLFRIVNHFGKSKTYVLIPFAEYPKSNDVILYLLTKCPVFKKLAGKKQIIICREINQIAIQDNMVLVYVDDFIGSAKSFHKWYKKSKVANKFGERQLVKEEQAILAAIIMEDGEKFISYSYPDINVFAESRSRIFSKQYSPFNLSGNRAALRSLCFKYGMQISTRFQWPNKVIYDPFGYDKTEALVAFEYGTPNNSLPIIWGDSKWTPIFPRSGKSRMTQASEIKNQAAFYLGLSHKLNINLDIDPSIMPNDADLITTVRDDHSIIVCLILLDKKYSRLQICQVLGITLFELNKIISKARRLFIVENDDQLTRKGCEFLRRLKKTANQFTFRSKNTVSIKDVIFVPKTFRNMT